MAVQLEDMLELLKPIMASDDLIYDFKMPTFLEEVPSGTSDSTASTKDFEKQDQVVESAMNGEYGRYS